MIKTVLEEKREIPAAGESDVLVIGGGLAGIAAAVAASRNGASVTLVEKSYVLGGLAMLTLPFMPQFRMTRRLIGLDEMSLTPGKHVEHSVGCVIHCLEARQPYTNSRTRHL